MCGARCTTAFYGSPARSGMTQRPHFLPRRTAGRRLLIVRPRLALAGGEMDPLSDVLRVVRLDGAYFYSVEATEPWSVHSVGAKELMPRLLPHAEHLICYHILTEGRCWAGVLGEEQVEMHPGDVVVFPHGDAHLMSSTPGLDGEPEYGTTPERYPHTVI